MVNINDPPPPKPKGALGGDLLVLNRMPLFKQWVENIETYAKLAKEELDTKNE